MPNSAENDFTDPSRLFGLIENIYAAAQEPSLWGGVLQQVLQVTSAESVALYADAPDSRSPGLVSMRGDALIAAWQAYAEYYAAINPMFPACQRVFRDDEIWRTSVALPNAEFEKTEFYNDFYKPNKMFHTMGIRLDLGSAPAASLSLQRDRPLGDFSAASEAVCQILRPHLQRALMLYHQLGAMQAAALGLEAALEAHGHAVIGIDTFGRIAFCSPSATAFLRDGSGIKLVAGKLRCARSQESHELHAAILTALNGGVGRAFMVPRLRGAALRVLVSPFRAALPHSPACISALVFISDPNEIPLSRAALLRELYGLTASESRVADYLSAGLDMREIAENCRITVETARFHVKRILTKTGARKQSELIRLMLTLPAME